MPWPKALSSRSVGTLNVAMARLQPQSGLARFFEFGSDGLLHLSKPKPHLSNPRTACVQSEADAAAMMLVSPGGTCYAINDTGPGGEDVAQLADRRADLPSKRANLEQMFGWKPSPHGVRRKVAEDWQLLQDVKWAERAGEFIPLVGSGANALKIFNQKRGTSHILDGSFRKFLSGARPFDGGWRYQDGVRPGWLNDLVDGSSLLGCRHHAELQAPPRSPPTPLAGGRSRLPAKKRPRPDCRSAEVQLGLQPAPRGVGPCPRLIGTPLNGTSCMQNAARDLDILATCHGHHPTPCIMCPAQALGGRLRAATRPHAVATAISLADANRLGLAEATLVPPAAPEAAPTSGSCSPSLRATSASGDWVAAAPEQQASCSQLQQAAHISSHSHIHTPTPTPTPTPLHTHTPTRARTHTHAHTGERRLGEA